jgi:uncharacterized delta-60 repeat protein
MKENLLFRLLFIFVSAFTYGQAGTLDTSFNGTGFRLIDTAVSSSAWGKFFLNSSSVIQNDGKIVIAGANNYDSITKLSVLRLNPDGTNDTAFGNNGFVSINQNISCSFNYSSIAIQQDGKIVIASTFYGTSDKMGVVRINSNGTIDNSFGTNGLKIIDINISGNAFVVKIQSDNKILVGGWTNEVSNANFGLARLLPNGDIDTTFGVNGMTESINGTIGVDSSILAMDVLPNGKIICSGYFYEINNTFHNFCTVRYNSDGSIDTNFGSNGMVLTAVDISDDEIHSQVIQPDGKIVVAGFASDDNVHGYIAMMRLNPNGSKDISFGVNGTVSQFITGLDFPKINSIALQPDGKIVAVGFGYNSFIARFNTYGSLDTTFNNTGFYICDFNPSLYSHGNFDTVFVLPDGKLLATGTTDYSDGTFALQYTTIARFNSVTLGTNDINFNEENVRVYPNPSTDIFNFDLSDTLLDYSTISVYNLLGETVYQSELLSKTNNAIDLSALNNGYYIARIANDSTSVQVKIIKK